MKFQIYPYITFTGIVAASLGSLFAQAQKKDTLDKQTINITSTYKPVLKNAARINFLASPPAPDTSRPALKYDIPPQQLYLSYQPQGLQPLALQQDTLTAWKNDAYVKAGFGNLTTPFLDAGIALGDPEKASVGFYGQHISSRGNIEYQDYAKTAFQLRSSLRTKNSLELFADAGYRLDTYHQYGYDHAIYQYEREEVRARYQTLDIKAGVRNLSQTAYGLWYDPRLEFTIFGDQRDNSENTTRLILPLEKSVGKVVAVRLSLEGDLTTYKPLNADVVKNNIFRIPVSLLFRTPNLNVQVGFAPSWDNESFKLLPTITGEVRLGTDLLIGQVGYVSYYNKGTFNKWSTYNPYLAPPTDLFNTRVIERYLGLKGSISSHFSYHAKFGLNDHFQAALFNNTGVDGKAFQVIREDQMKVIQMQGGISWTKGDRISLQAGLIARNFADLKSEENAWGIIPYEINGSFRWQVLKDLYFKADAFLFGGPAYKSYTGKVGELKDAADLNAGVEFKIARNWALWLQFNNIFNNKYQRWYQYETYGFNFTGGVIFTLDPKGLLKR